MHPSAKVLAFALAALGACPLREMEDRLARADEHLFWTEFWTELDEGEAGRELAYAIDELQRAQALTAREGCGQDALTRTTVRLIHERLSACLHARRQAP